MINLNTDLLSKFSIFNDLSNTQIEKFIPYIKLVSIDGDNDIINEGDDGDSLIFLFSGEITITKAMTLITNKTDVDTREKEMTRLDSSIHPFFGEMSLFNENDKRTASITALTNCEIGILYAKDFFNIGDQDPETGHITMKNIASQLHINNHIF